MDVDAYNSHFVELSKAPDIMESREAIKKVMQVRLANHLKLCRHCRGLSENCRDPCRLGFDFRHAA